MTLLSKIKTLIEYAKVGMAVCKISNDGTADELYLPKALKRYTVGSPLHQWTATRIKKLSGRAEIIGGNQFLLNHHTVEIIDLPECYNLLTSPWTNANGNSNLKIAKLPKVRELNGKIFQRFVGLEYLELGQLWLFNNQALESCSALKEFYIGKDTMSNLYLQYCTQLTTESINSIIENFADCTTLATSPIIYFGETNINKIDEEHIIMLENKNISYQ